jgi:hypothetical protein
MCKSSNRLFTQPEARGEVSHKALRAWLFENSYHTLGRRRPRRRPIQYSSEGAVKPKGRDLPDTRMRGV